MKPLRWVVTLAYASVIFYLSSRPWGGIPLFPHADKIIHLAIYFGLSALCVWSLRATALKWRSAIFPMAFVLATLYGVTDEVHQLFVPGRSCSVADLAFDGVGAFLGAWLAVIIVKKWRKERI